KILCRVYWATISPCFVVQVRPGRFTRIAGYRKTLALLHLLTLFHQRFRQVAIVSIPPTRVGQEHVPSRTAWRLETQNCATHGSKPWRTNRHSKVNTSMRIASTASAETRSYTTTLDRANHTTIGITGHRPMTVNMIQ